MFDYYRARFSQILPPRHPQSRLGGERRIEMPAPLRAAYGICGALVAAGLLGAAVLGGPPGRSWLSTALAVSILTLPISFALWIGFGERQSWTRPLMAVLPGCAAAVAWRAGARGVAALLIVVAGGLTLYLYRSQAVRSYYAYLQGQSDPLFIAANLERAPLVSSAFIVIGLVVGATLGYAAVGLLLPHGASTNVNEITGLVAAMVLSGAGGAALGDAAGRRFVERWRAAPDDGDPPA